MKFVRTFGLVMSSLTVFDASVISLDLIDKQNPPLGDILVGIISCHNKLQSI